MLIGKKAGAENMSSQESPSSYHDREITRAGLESHFRQLWSVPASAVFFQTKRFRLDGAGRSNMRAASFIGKVGWILCLPFFVVYLLVASILSAVAINLPALEDKDTVKPGTVRVLGVVKAEQVINLIDALRRGRRGGWLVLAQGRAAFIKGSAPKTAVQPIWTCVDSTMKLSLNVDQHNEMNLAWPSVARASLYLDSEECAHTMRSSRNFS